MNIESNSHLISQVNSQPLVSDNSIKSKTGSSERKPSTTNSSLSELTQHNIIDLTQSEDLTDKSNDCLHSTPLNVNSLPFTSAPPPQENDNTLITYQAFRNHNLVFFPTCERTQTLDNSVMMTEFDERFGTGRTFQTLTDLRTAAYEFGKKYNVALTTSKSDKTKVYLICKHGGEYRQNKRTAKMTDEKDIRTRVRKSQKTGCKCIIYARRCKDSFWIIRKSIGEHNHPIAEDPRTYAMYRSLSPENLLLVHRLLRERVAVSYIIKSLKASGVTNVIAKDIENIQQDMKRRDIITGPQATENNSTTDILPATTNDTVQSSPIN